MASAKEARRKRERATSLLHSPTFAEPEPCLLSEKYGDQFINIPEYKRRVPKRKRKLTILGRVSTPAQDEVLQEKGTKSLFENEGIKATRAFFGVENGKKVGEHHRPMLHKCLTYMWDNGLQYVGVPCISRLVRALEYHTFFAPDAQVTTEQMDALLQYVDRINPNTIFVVANDIDATPEEDETFLRDRIYGAAKLKRYKGKKKHANFCMQKLQHIIVRLFWQGRSVSEIARDVSSKMHKTVSRSTVSRILYRWLAEV